MTDSKDRALEIHEITFDARDSHALAVFWGALLEREIRPGDMPQDDSVLVMPTPGQPGLLFLRVPESTRLRRPHRRLVLDPAHQRTPPRPQHPIAIH